MADSKKYNGSTWEHSLRKLTTATDTITTLPADLYADGNFATVGLQGNMTQTGTPTPQNPIQPQETGERTENLFDYSAITTGYRIQWITGDPYADDAAIMSDYIPVSEGDYTLNISLIIVGYAADKSYIGVYRSEKTWEKLPSNRLSTFTVLSGTNVKFVRLLTYGGGDPITNALMLNTGSTALPYEPYGYKIPISSGNTTTPVYLGEVQTTRKIKKLVLTGEETGWNRTSIGGRGIFYLDTIAPDYLRSDDITLLCSHYKAIAGVAGASYVGEGETAFYKTNTVNQRLYFGDSNYSGTNYFKSYLAQQYAAGTPVTVWYVLATPTTGIVNEPIRKIGDYADTVSGITIPTLSTADTFDVQTTLKPSEVSLAYAGWHDATVKEWDDSQWQ